MHNSIAYTKNYTSILDAVYQRASVSGCLTSGRRMVRFGRNAKEIMIPKIEVSGLGDYTRNVGYKTGSINYAFETKTFNYAESGSWRTSWTSRRLGVVKAAQMR